MFFLLLSSINSIHRSLSTSKGIEQRTEKFVVKGGKNITLSFSFRWVYVFIPLLLDQILDRTQERTFLLSCSISVYSIFPRTPFSTAWSVKSWKRCLSPLVFSSLLVNAHSINVGSMMLSVIPNSTRFFLSCLMKGRALQSVSGSNLSISFFTLNENPFILSLMMNLSYTIICERGWNLFLINGIIWSTFSLAGAF